jgi:hypothetical protein
MPKGPLRKVLEARSREQMLRAQGFRSRGPQEPPQPKPGAASGCTLAFNLAGFSCKVGFQWASDDLVLVTAEASFGGSAWQVRFGSDLHPYLGKDRAVIKRDQYKAELRMAIVDPDSPSVVLREAVIKMPNSPREKPTLILQAALLHEKILRTEVLWEQFVKGQIRPIPVLVDMVCGEGSPLLKLHENIQKLAAKQGAVWVILITGPTGAGKAGVAKAVAAALGRLAQFCYVQCGLLKSQGDAVVRHTLFGCGPKSGLVGMGNGRLGLLSQAHGGALLFDDVDCLSVVTQEMLLGVFQGEGFTRDGDDRALRVDVVYVLATNADVEALIGVGAMRRDFRARVTHEFAIPPLRERIGDIPALVVHFLKKHPGVKLGEDLLKSMLWYEWPENVRELEHFFDYLHPREQAWTLADIEREAVGMPPILLAKLKEAYRAYEAARRDKPGNDKEERLASHLAGIAANILPRAFTALYDGQEARWGEIIAEGLKRFGAQLVTAGFCEEGCVVRCEPCGKLLQCCSADREMPRRILRRAFRILREQSVTWSGEGEAPRYRTFERFFGVSERTARRWAKGA